MGKGGGGGSSRPRPPSLIMVYRNGKIFLLDYRQGLVIFTSCNIQWFNISEQEDVYVDKGSNPPPSLCKNDKGRGGRGYKLHNLHTVSISQ